MNQVLLAPQFGLGRAKVREPDESSPSPAQAVSAASVFAPAAGGPQVTIKRRRVLEVPKADSAGELPAGGATKAPKVYQVSQVAVVAAVAAAEVREEPPLAAAAAGLQDAPPAAPRLRRRRDPSRQPTLVQHVVFEPAPEPTPPAAPTQAAAAVGIDASDAKQLRDALAVLDAELQRVARCEEAYRSLDAHLKQLRVGKTDR